MSTNRNLNKAFKFFKDKFQPYRTGEEIATMLSNIADGLLFTTITVTDDLNAYIVFETLNARGVRLSTPDLLKNYLLSIMAREDAYSEEQFSEFEEQWKDILNQLGETEFTNFLRSYRAMRKKLVNKRDLFRVLKEDVKEPQAVLPFLGDLEKNAAIYAALQEPHDPFWKEDDGKYSEVVPYLEALKTFNVKTPLSLLMIGFHKLSVRDFIKLLKRIVTISIRYNVICRKSPNDQEHIYNRMANTLANTGISLHDLTDMLRPVYPSDQEFQTAFNSKIMPSRQSKKKSRFLLAKIEQQLSSNEPPLSLTLEHILPFSPQDSWQQSFGRNNYEEAINRLGNMALLAFSKNRDIGQKNFQAKRELLSKSPYRINQHIAEYSEWNIENLNDHQKWLAQQAKTVWKISQLV